MVFQRRYTIFKLVLLDWPDQLLALIHSSLEGAISACRWKRVSPALIEKTEEELRSRDEARKGYQE